MKNPTHFWTKEKCQKIALKYNTKTDFRLNDNYPYIKAYKNGWLDNICVHMLKSDKKPKGYWTKERCIELSHTCKNRKDFIKKYKSSYDVCCKNNWLNDIIGESRKQLRNHWTKERCHEKSLKYEYKKDFRKYCSIAFSRASSNGWLDDICLHMKPLGNKNKRCIYSFIFSDSSVYVGLTYNYEKRIKQHLEKENSAVYQHLSSGLTYFTNKLTNYIDVEKAKKWEKKYVKYYKDKGNNILNKVKTGGIGSILIWTKDKCLEEAMKYDSRKKFNINSISAYNRSRKEGWLDDICSHMIQKVKPNGYWTKERCKDISLKYDRRVDFFKNDSVSYNTCQKNGWLDEVCVHMKKEYTKEECKKMILEYNSRIEIRDKNTKLYYVLRKYKWLDELCSHMKDPKIKWTKEKCQEESLKYKTRGDFCKTWTSKVAIKNGWLDEICSHM